MVNNVEVINLYKHTIIYKKKKNTKILSFISIFVLLLVSVATLGFINQEYDKNSKFSETVMELYNPQYSPFVDMNGVVFTNGTKYDFINNTLDIKLPLLSSKIEVNDSEINITAIECIVISACENGIIYDIGETTDKIKYIKIQHSNDVITVIENYDICSVNKGDVVKKNQKLGTVKQNEVLKFYIVINNEKINNLKLENDSVLWEN